jgi:hypothetical protein
MSGWVTLRPLRHSRDNSTEEDENEASEKQAEAP